MTTEVTRFSDGVTEDEFAYTQRGYLTPKIGTPGMLKGVSEGSLGFGYPPEIMTGGAVKPGERRDIEVVAYMDGIGLPERQLLVAGEMGRLDVGGCVYDSYPVEIVYLAMEPRESDRFACIPVLDTALFLSATDADGAGIFAVAPLSIQVLE
ncbi:MAG: hypothetical protein R3D63_00745 [Paracoccaceae bacterium]